MANIAFFYNNLWKDYIPAPSTQHPNFPAENTQNRETDKTWRSMYGAGSGWGRFVISAGVNDKIDITDEGGAKVATVNPGVYTADTLSAAIEAALELVSANNYTGSYLEAGADANKFKIRCETRAIDINWNTGPNKAISIAGTIGFDDSADDLAAQEFIADYIRIHSLEIVYEDFEAVKDIHGAIIKKHNLQPTAVAGFHCSNDNFVTTPFAPAFTIQDDILVVVWSPAESYQYVRFYLSDPDNPDLFVEMGVCFVGGMFQPTRNFVRGSVKPIDQSVIKRSDTGKITSLQKPKYKTKAYTFEGTNQFAEFDAMFNAVGTSKALFVVENPGTPLSTTKYIQFVDWDWSPIPSNGIFWNLTVFYEELV